MAIVVWFLVGTIILFLIFFDRWRIEKKMFIFLQAIAKRLAIETKDLSRVWSTTGVSLDGRWNAVKVTLELFSTSKGIEILLELNSKSSVRLKIRRARNFFNFNFMELINTPPPKVKFQTSSNNDFEVVSNDPSNSIRIFNLSGLKQRLELCIIGKDDVFEIDENRILVKTSSDKFFGSIDWEDLEEKFVQMWFLATSISVILPSNIKTDINLLRCPYCRNMLNDGVKIVRCNSCYTMFHESCWSENGQCAIFSCYGSTSEAIDAKASNLKSEIWITSQSCI